MTDFAKRLTAAMSMHGWNITELAEASAVSRNTLYSYTNLDYTPRKKDILHRLARALNVSSEWLKSGRDTDGRAAALFNDLQETEKAERRQYDKEQTEESLHRKLKQVNRISSKPHEGIVRHVSEESIMAAVHAQYEADGKDKAETEEAVDRTKGVLHGRYGRNDK